VHPRDTTYWPRLDLAPTHHLCALVRDRYRQVNKADNFLLKIRKAEQPLGCASLAVRRFEGAIG
jgi:hypothetical protein